MLKILLSIQEITVILIIPIIISDTLFRFPNAEIHQMLTKKKLTTAAAASFGAAMASIHCAPELQADIVDLTFSPGSVAFGSLGYIFVNEVGASFAQWNDGIGQTILAGAPGSGTFLDGVRVVSNSQTLNASTFPGVGTGGTILPPYGSGTAYFGFHFQGNVGWFSADLGGGVNGITYLAGEYGSAGESVTVGGTDAIPEPTTFGALAALALGAAGIRRRRK